MKYRALILDVDGTLVGRDFLISDRVKKAIQSVQNDFLVSLCSGRVYRSIEVFVKELNLSALQISDGGGEIFDPVLQKSVYKKIIDQSVVWSIVSDLKKNGLKFVASCNQDYHIDISTTTPEDLVKYRFSVKAFPDLNTLKNPAFTKISILGVTTQNQKFIEGILRKYSKSIHYISAAYHESDQNHFHALDITEKSATKLTGLEEYVRLNGIKLSETVVVGDGYNDYPLLTAGGLKIAMGNAVKELRAIADFVAPSVYEDGVAMVIEKFLK